MIIASPHDYRRAAQRILPPFLFHYIDGGSYNEHTLSCNVTDLVKIPLKQRVLRNTAKLDTSTSILSQSLAIPVVLAPVGLAGMYARRGEVQASKAAKKMGTVFTMSSVSVCPIEEVTGSVDHPMWFQLYVLKDRGFMKNVLDRAQEAGVKTLVFTVDMPVPGARYRDKHSGMSGSFSSFRRILQAMIHPRWAWDVGLRGKPHDLGNISIYRQKQVQLIDYIGWLTDNFDPSITWKDLEWIRDYWQGNIVVKGVLHDGDAQDAVKFGADGIVVSNHGGRQLDGVLSSVRALPDIAQKVKGDLIIFSDSGVRTGLDVVRMIALGADCVMIGRSYIYALAAAGQAGVENLLALYMQEMKVAMTLTGCCRIADINEEVLTGVTH